MRLLSPGDRVWIYATAPASMLAGYATVREVQQSSKTAAWRHHRQDLGMSKTEFDTYLNGADQACLVVWEQTFQLASPIGLDELRQLDAEFHPPQFYTRFKQGQRLLTDRRFKPCRPHP